MGLDIGKNALGFSHSINWIVSRTGDKKWCEWFILLDYINNGKNCAAETRACWDHITVATTLLIRKAADVLYCPIGSSSLES